MDELQQLREEIDQIDRQMVELFRQRMAVTGQVGQYKLAHGLPVLDAARERQVLQDKARLVDGDLRPGVTTLFQTIMSISRRQQRDMTREGADNPGLPRFVQALSGVRTPVEHPRVVFQGVAGAYSEQACVNFFGEEVDATGLPQFEDAFVALKEGRADYAVLPIENSSTGAIRQIYDLLAQYDFFLVGEILHGDYKTLVNDQMLHSCTNYECYKGLYSSFNSMNLFEINHSLLRQFGPEGWTLYKGLHLMTFVDNHDVSRVASILTNEKHLPLIYALAFGMPGIPCIYYGSEWGAKGNKSDGDPALRPSFEEPVENELTEFVGKLSAAKKGSKALNYGGFRSVVLTNKQCIFERAVEGERVLVAINADSEPYTAHFDAGCGMAVDLITGREHDFGGGSELPPYSAFFWRCEA